MTWRLVFPRHRLLPCPRCDEVMAVMGQLHCAALWPMLWLEDGLFVVLSVTRNLSWFDHASWHPHACTCPQLYPTGGMRTTPKIDQHRAPREVEYGSLSPCRQYGTGQNSHAATGNGRKRKQTELQQGREFSSGHTANSQKPEARATSTPTNEKQWIRGLNTASVQAQHKQPRFY